MLQTSSKTIYKPEFETQFELVDDDAKPVIARVVNDLAQNYVGHPWDHDDVGYIESQDLWRAKIKDGPADHRIYFDMRDDGTLVFLTVYHKDDA